MADDVGPLSRLLGARRDPAANYSRKANVDMKTCEICDAKCTAHHQCNECMEGGMCKVCASDPTLHYCKFAKRAPYRRSQRAVSIPRYDRKSVQSIDSFLRGVSR